MPIPFALPRPGAVQVLRIEYEDPKYKAERSMAIDLEGIRLDN